METQFVPFELAVKLKELGFNEHCFKHYDAKGKFAHTLTQIIECKAPLWQQAFDFVMEIITELPGRYSTVIQYHTKNFITIKDCPWNNGIQFNSKKDCLEYLISLCK